MHSLPSILMQAPPSFISALKGERQEREEREERGQQENSGRDSAGRAVRAVVARAQRMACCVWTAAVLHV